MTNNNYAASDLISRLRLFTIWVITLKVWSVLIKTSVASGLAGKLVQYFAHLLHSKGIHPSVNHDPTFWSLSVLQLLKISKWISLAATQVAKLLYGFLLDRTSLSFSNGEASCQSPAINRLCSDAAKESIEFCDSARFSMYIDCNLVAYPCSFAHGIKSMR